MKKGFESVEMEALLSLARTFHLVSIPFSKAMEAKGLTGPQYNVLRILRGSRETGLPCGEISGRMVTQDSDITRLLDRLVKNGLVVRTRQENDRRVVISQITQKGLDLLEEIDPILRELHKTVMGCLPEAKQRTLISLLQELRDGQTKE